MADLFAQAGSQPASTFHIRKKAGAGCQKRADAQCAAAEDDPASRDRRVQFAWDACSSSGMCSEHPYDHAVGASNPLAGLVDNALRASDSGLIDLHLGPYLRPMRSEVRAHIINAPHSDDEITNTGLNPFSTPSLLLEDPSPTLEPSSPASETSSIIYASSSSSASWTGDDEFIPRRRDRLPYAKTTALTPSDTDQNGFLPVPVITATASHSAPRSHRLSQGARKPTPHHHYLPVVARLSPSKLSPLATRFRPQATKRHVRKPPSCILTLRAAQRKDSQQSPLESTSFTTDAVVVIVDEPEHHTSKEL